MKNEIMKAIKESTFKRRGMKFDSILSVESVESEDCKAIMYVRVKFQAKKWENDKAVFKVWLYANGSLKVAFEYTCE